MNCPKCGKPVQAGASFCMNCGQMLGSAAAAPAGQTGVMPQAFAAGNARNRTTVLAAMTALAILALLLFGLQAAGILKFGNSVTPGTALRAKGSLGESMLKTPGKALGANLTAQATRPLEMPQDVWDWLEHLRRIEARKNELYIQQATQMKVFQQELGVLGPAIGEMDPYDQTGDLGKEPSGVVKGKFNDLRPDWLKLVDDFNAVPPPAECVPIANDYRRAVSEIPGMIGDLMSILNTASSDPQKALTEASKMKNKSYGNIDTGLISTDKRVQQICDKYNKKKWFNIKTDVDGTDSLSKMGF